MVFDTNLKPSLVEHRIITSPFVGALHPDSVPVVVKGISLDPHPKKVRKTTVLSKNLLRHDLKHVKLAVVQNLFPQEQRSRLSAGRLKHFQENWKKLKSDPQILVLEEGYQIPFSSEPKKTKPPNPAHLCQLFGVKMWQYPVFYWNLMNLWMLKFRK